MSTGLSSFLNHYHAIQGSFSNNRVEGIYDIWVCHRVSLDERWIKNSAARLFKPRVCYVFLRGFIMCVPHLRPRRLLLFWNIWKVVVYRRLTNTGLAECAVAWGAYVMTLRLLLLRLFIFQSELVYFFLSRWCASVSANILISLVNDLPNELGFNAVNDGFIQIKEPCL